MSRSGYSEDGDSFDDFPELAYGRYRGRITSATRGKRGQAFFRDLLAALDAMPDKRLITNELETREGSVCAIGALGKARGVPMSDLDPENADAVAFRFGIAEILAREVVYMNDESGPSYNGKETPEERWTRMRAWVASQINPTPDFGVEVAGEAGRG